MRHEGTVANPGIDIGWEVDVSEEGGQPNGGGEVEPSGAREWFSPERETHHRQVITYIGPWEDGASEEGARAKESGERSRAAEKARHEERVLREAREILGRKEQA